MKPTASELFALWGAFSLKSGVVCAIPVPKTRKTRSLYDGLNGALFSIHVQSWPLRSFPISNQRKRNFARLVLGMQKELNGNNVALIGPHAKAIIDRLGGSCQKSYRVPICVAGIVWLAFSLSMLILHLWFVLASLLRGNLKSAFSAFKDYAELVSKGPCSFSTYYIVYVQ